jgi:hypothetical protein
MMVKGPELAPPTPVDATDVAILEPLLTSLDIPKGTERVPGAALLFCHQLPTWVYVVHIAAPKTYFYPPNNKRKSNRMNFAFFILVHF